MRPMEPGLVTSPRVLVFLAFSQEHEAIVTSSWIPRVDCDLSVNLPIRHRQVLGDHGGFHPNHHLTPTRPWPSKVAEIAHPPLKRRVVLAQRLVSDNKVHHPLAADTSEGRIHCWDRNRCRYGWQRWL